MFRAIRSCVRIIAHSTSTLCRKISSGNEVDEFAAVALASFSSISPALGAEPAFPSFCHLLRSRHTSVTVLICRPSSHYSAAESDFEAPSRVPDLWLVLNDDFRPAASHIRGSPGEADRLAAAIGPQTQREQID